MLVLHCDVGYGPATTKTSAVNLTDVTWTDRDTLFTIPSGVPADIYTQIKTDSYQTLYNELSAYITSGIDAIYSFLTQKGGKANSFFWETGLNQLLNQFPSIDKAYPNWWAWALSDHDSVKIPYIYVKELNKLLVINSIDETDVYNIYKVNPDSSCELLAWSSDAGLTSAYACNYCSSPNVRYWGFIRQLVFNENGDGDVTNYGNYFAIEIMVGIGGSDHYPHINIYPVYSNEMFLPESRGFLKEYFKIFWGDYRPDNVPDPFAPGGTTEPSGGTGDFSDNSDNIEIPPLPTLSTVNTGFITLFNPSIAQLRELASYMWSDLFDITAWRKIFADPMDAILGMSIVPVNVPAGETAPVTVGNISTGVSMTKAASQFVTVDCGTLNVKEYWGAYLDYDPYTKAEIYLPYIGTHALAVDDIMNKLVHVVYHIDILSGACCAYVKCGNSVLYTFVGQCSCSIPITGNDWTNVINGALSIATAIGSMVATGGASAPLAVSNIAASAINSMKPNVEKSGSLGGMGGMMGIQTPYLILTRPRQALPANQNAFMGYPSFITYKLSEITGYTEVESIHLENIPATEQELSEIETLLKGGVIL